MRPVKQTGEAAAAEVRSRFSEFRTSSFPMEASFGIRAGAETEPPRRRPGIPKIPSLNPERALEAISRESEIAQQIAPVVAAKLRAAAGHRELIKPSG